jgi:hypothetical protein
LDATIIVYFKFTCHNKGEAVVSVCFGRSMTIGYLQLKTVRSAPNYDSRSVFMVK